MAKIKSIEFGEADQPEYVTVRMTTEEAALIAKLTSGHSARSIDEVMYGGDPALIGLYECTTGLFKRFYDEGVEEWIRDHF